MQTLQEPAPQMLFVGVPHGPFRSRLTRHLPHAQFRSDSPDPSIAACDLAVLILCAGEDAARQEFTTTWYRANVASLCVEVGERELLIGPLSLPDRAGCGVCAAQRMRGAAVALGASPGTEAAPDGAAGHGSSPWRSRALADLLALALREMLGGHLTGSGLRDHILAIDRGTRDHAMHSVIPLPWCTVCGGAARRLRDARGPAKAAASIASSPGRVLAALDGLVDAKTGIIASITLESSVDSQQPLPFVVTAAPPVVAGDDTRVRTMPVGWGKGLTVPGAVVSAVGEAVERYAASLPDASRVQWCRPDEIEGDYLDPRTLPLYAESQYRRAGFPFARYNPRIQHPWVRGRWLDTDRPVWLPAVLVYLSLDLQPAQLFCQGTSNGLAAGSTVADAELRATLELVERDALLAGWLTATPGQRLLLDSSCDSRLRQIVNNIEASGANVELYLLGTGVYGSTVLCLAFGDGIRFPGVTVAIGTAPAIRPALRSAILELGQTGPFLQRMMHSGNWSIPADAASVTEMRQHASYYFPRERVRAFDRIRSTHQALRVRDVPRLRPDAPLQHCASSLAASGIRVAVVDVTSPDIALGPFRVVRAVSPDLQPISFGFRQERQPCARIRALGVRRPAPAVQPIW